MPEKPPADAPDLAESRRAIAEAKEAAKEAHLVEPPEQGEAEEEREAESPER
ncbi:hypothetical protein [Amycolatopsis sp.]|uniref:hypothetical protein n=1 Tax=Amycolatopsis sp. TaxID=37632 RepID=UPI002BE59BE6|nr:hypothetical protein [Amycolatopsis sp.]HVV13645.1 hypothetical protein [Amycolatopsis sp.]